LHYADSHTPVGLQALTCNNGETVRLGLRDFAPARPADAWQRLQSHLGSGAQALHARPQSSGLGLYIASQFAEAMHGRIGAIRHRDGATFYVDINDSTQLSLL
jgi:K+-sensing histidine kinase KdpD